MLANPPVSRSPILRQKAEFKKRVAFTMKRRVVKEKLKKLDECNGRLYGFLEKAGKIQENTVSEDLDSRLSIQFVAPLHVIQKNATRVHRVIHHKWCKDHCELSLHRAGLLLEKRISRRQRKVLKGHCQTTGRCFGLSFSRGTTSPWLDVEFTLDEISNTVSM